MLKVGDFVEMAISRGLMDPDDYYGVIMELHPRNGFMVKPMPLKDDWRLEYHPEKNLTKSHKSKYKSEKLRYEREKKVAEIFNA